VRFRTTVAGRIAGFRFYDGFVAGGNNSMLCQLWTWGTPRQALRTAPFFWHAGSVGAMWHQKWFRPWFRPTIGDDYLILVLFPGGAFYRTNTALASPPVTHNGISFMSSTQTTALDQNASTLAENTNANAVDILFYPD
jgi:hypothetical protein